MQAAAAMSNGNLETSIRFTKQAQDAGLSDAQEAYASAITARTSREAIALLRVAVEKEPYFVLAWEALCAELTFLGERSDAREAANTALGRFPRHPSFVWIWEFWICSKATLNPRELG